MGFPQVRGSSPSFLRLGSLQHTGLTQLDELLRHTRTSPTGTNREGLCLHHQLFRILFYPILCREILNNLRYSALTPPS